MRGGANLKYEKNQCCSGSTVNTNVKPTFQPRLLRPLGNGMTKPSTSLATPGKMESWLKEGKEKEKEDIRSVHLVLAFRGIKRKILVCLWTSPV